MRKCIDNKKRTFKINATKTKKLHFSQKNDNLPVKIKLRDILRKWKNKLK